MRHPILLAAILAMGAPMATAGFPDVTALPSRPEMPDPLVMLDGTKAETREQWESKRKPELKALFEHYMFGRMPATSGKLTLTTGSVKTDLFGGKATMKLVAINAIEGVDHPIHLLLVIPNKRSKPAPVFLGANFNGNHTALAEPTIPLPTTWMPPNSPGTKDNRATEAGRGQNADVWSIEAAIDRGYAVATFYAGDVAPDHPGFADGVFPHFAKPGQTRPEPDEWGAVAAWAWGLMRAVDFLQSEPEIDPHKIAIVGHSRMGKAALLAGAFDDRVALTVVHQAGCGGSAPSRGKVGEQVKQINDRFPHWFAATFHEFNDHVDRLPFDQNGLIALAAPRPVLLTNGDADTWANPLGQFDALKGADGVYRLYGVNGIDAKEAPAVGMLAGDRLGYHIRPGKHAMEPRDWTVWLDFADKQLGKPSP